MPRVPRNCHIGFSDTSILNLSRKRIQDDDVRSIAQTLKDKNIKYLDLSNSNMSNAGIKHLANILKGSQVERLLLSCSHIQDEGLKYLSECLKDMPITRLVLDNNDISCEGIKYLTNVLKDTKIESLLLYKNNIKDKGLNYLTQVLPDTQITYLFIKSNIIGYDAASNLNKVLHNTKIDCLSLHIYKESHDSSYLCVEQFSNCITERNKKMRHRITLYDDGIGHESFRYFNDSFQTSGIHELRLRVELKRDNVHFAVALENIVIHKLIIPDAGIWEKGKLMAKAFKGCSIITLLIEGMTKRFSDAGLEHLVRFLEEVHVLIFELSGCQVNKVLFPQLMTAIQKSTIMEINFKANGIGLEIVKSISQVLQDSKIMYLNLIDNRIKMNGIKHLAESLPNSQVTHINLDEFNNNLFLEYLNHTDIVKNSNIAYVDFIKKGAQPKSLKIKRSTTSTADKVRDHFQTTVALNPVTNEFEFILPIDSTSIDQHIFLLKTLFKFPTTKVHIYDAMCRKELWFGEYTTYDFNLMKKINKFIEAMSQKFNNFLNERLSDLMVLLGNNINNYINVVKQFEDAKIDDIVQNLLLHRILYYMDGKQEILHPFIYKLLNKYKMPLYNEQLEPGKKEKIISYFQNHPEIDGAQDIVHFFKTGSCNDG